ncbi:catalase family protein [Pseudomonas typographi]|uniref:catalase family protein n=1 Tax=Pseudomonas typographi TaxID=2715964 RepID=UPI0016888A62|nr:catalase family protein [Pseudomonas typographi]MBD1550859.1 catalase family protein [Pseudomonas typographi]
MPDVQPLPFDPAFEQKPDDEDQTIAEMVEVLRSISQTTYASGGHALRSVHAKSHGLLKGTFEVLGGLPAEYAQGAFAAPLKGPCVLRLSTNPGDILADSVSTPRGLAVKMIGVPGTRLAGSEGLQTQDWVMQDAPAFSAPTPKAFLKTLKLLAKTTDRAEGLKKALSAVLRGSEKVVEAFGGQSPTLKSLGGHPETHPLGETFYTLVPILYGKHFAKLSVAPVSPELQALTDAPLNVNGKPDGLREAVNDFFATQGGVWEIRVQLGVDIEKTPIEDASVVWPEALAPYVTVARIEVPAQPAWTEALSKQIDDGMLFSPWQALAAHRPLGGIMRSRKPAYEMSGQWRAEHNGCPMHHPSRGEPL